jgi:hypothetical protein
MGGMPVVRIEFLKIEKPFLQLTAFSHLKRRQPV